MGKLKEWWGAPQKLSEHERDRKVSWLELFSDLAYVVMIHNIITSFVEHMNGLHLYDFLLVFLLVFYIWIDYAYFFDLHAVQNVRTTFLNLIQIVFVVLISSQFSEIFAGNISILLMVMVVAHVFFLYIWTGVLRVDPEHWESAWLYFTITISSLLGLIACVFVNNKTFIYVILWIIVLMKYVMFLINSFAMTSEQNRRGIKIETSKTLVERFGLVTMIVLGEGVAMITENINGALLQKNALISGLIFLNIIAIWWIYYTLMGDVYFTAKHQLKIELFNFLEVCFIVTLVVMLLYLHIFLEDPISSNLMTYLWWFLVAVIEVFILNIYANWKFNPLKFVETIFLLVTVIIATKLSVVWAISLVDAVIITNILLTERHNFLSKKEN